MPRDLLDLGPVQSAGVSVRKVASYYHYHHYVLYYYYYYYYNHHY